MNMHSFKTGQEEIAGKANPVQRNEEWQQHLVMQMIQV